MQSNTAHRRILYIGVIIISLAPITAVSEEFSAFRLTGVEGNIAVQRLSDEQLQGQTGGTKSRNSLTTTDEEISFLTHSYVYHPNLLNIDFGAGVLFTQNKAETQPADTSLEPPATKSEYDDESYSLTARLSFLEKKPYPFMLYYDRSYPTVSASVSERFIQKHEKYGVNASLIQPLLPFSMNLEVSSQNQEGRGSTQIVNNQTDIVQWRAYRSIGKTGYGQLTYYNTQYHAQNGIIDPQGDVQINEQDTTSESVSLDTYFDFGARRQFNFNNLLSYYTQDNLPEREEFRWTPNLSWKHTERTTSFYRYDYFNSKVENTENLMQTGAVGIRSELTETVAVNGGIHGEQTKTNGFEQQARGLNGNISYTRPLSFGRLQLSAGGRYDENERKGPAAVADKKGESIRLDGLQKVALAFPHVTEEFKEIRVIHADPARQHIKLDRDTDYEIEFPTGDTGPAYIRRLGTSDLESGETVLVDYQYRTGGSVTYSSFNQNYNAQLDFFDYYAVYISYSDTETELKEGLPNIPPSSTTYTRTGARVDHPFLQDDLILGAEAIREEMEDDFSPYVRKSYDTYIEARFFIDTRLRLSSRRVMQDNQRSDQDVDLRRQTARLTMHPFPRSSLSFEMSNEKDTGGALQRRIKEKAIVARWRIRKLLITLDGRSIVETQGSFEREHNVFMARLNREF